MISPNRENIIGDSEERVRRFLASSESVEEGASSESIEEGASSESIEEGASSGLITSGSSGTGSITSGSFTMSSAAPVFVASLCAAGVFSITSLFLLQ